MPFSLVSLTLAPPHLFETLSVTSWRVGVQTNWGKKGFGRPLSIILSQHHLLQDRSASLHVGLHPSPPYRQLMNRRASLDLKGINHEWCVFIRTYVQELWDEGPPMPQLLLGCSILVVFKLAGWEHVATLVPTNILFP